MKLIIYCLGLIFCLFPYTQIIKIDTYTQPYAFIFCSLAAAVAFPTLRGNFPAKDAIALIGLTFLGIIGFLVNCMPGPTPQELKYLLIYICPIAFAFAGFGIAVEYPKAADRIITAAALAWMAVGVIQSVVDPTFASQLVGSYSDVAEAVVDSGRGTLGLAPEPTHFGFHMIILATALVLVGGRNWLSIACLITALIIARSSSAALALALGALIYLIIYGKKARLLLLLVFPLYFLLGLVIESHMLPENIRLVRLLGEFYQDPLLLLSSDASTNARLGGIYVGAKQIIAQSFFPAGLTEDAWLDAMGPIMAQNPWLLMLSGAGIPSGILIVVFQFGFIALAPLVFIIQSMMKSLRSQYETFLLCAVLFVFFSQYMISTPGFGMIYGFVIARRLYAARANSLPAKTSEAPAPARLALA